ncbi:hypothetical protein SAMN04488136_103207 [Vibrio xiamenensis]|uniref:Uncharacterized protein n=2 Tax=Vibrio xiamenensis TaxID=861298 RepID=A0A1G7XJJ8_9VIBR|nr:hypothetical protein SAMN04488136_103207 [Vibrio xiamenensis]
MPRVKLPRDKAMSLLFKTSSIVIALILGVIAAEWFSQLRQTQNAIDLSAYCQISNTACTQQNVTIQANSARVHPLVPTQLQVTWPQHSAQQLTLTLQGLEMEMGTVKFVLNRAANQEFTGKITLPVCTNREMTWIGELSDGSLSVKTAIRMER